MITAGYNFRAIFTDDTPLHLCIFCPVPKNLLSSLTNFLEPLVIIVAIDRQPQSFCDYRGRIPSCEMVLQFSGTTNTTHGGANNDIEWSLIVISEHCCLKGQYYPMK